MPPSQSAPSLPRLSNTHIERQIPREFMMPGLLNFDDLSPSLNGSLKSSPLEACLDMLNREIKSLLEKERESRHSLEKITIDLEAFKAAYVSSEDKRKKLSEHTVELEKQNSDMNNQLKGHRVTVIIDGDGAIFDGDLIVQGFAGGHAAARKLNDHIRENLADIAPFQLKAHVFLNKRGLADAFGRAGFPNARSKLDDFILGINQAAERFLVIDVGHGKEAADAKVRACLDDELRLPQNLKVIFGGCHDNGYVSTLRSHLTAGYGSKLILLPGYADMAQGIADLRLPTIVIPDLFLQHKLRPSSPVTDLLLKKDESSLPPAAPPTPPATRQRSATNPTPAEATTLPSSPGSYSSALQQAPKRSMTPDPVPRCESPRSNRSNSMSETSPSKNGRHPTSGLPLSKHKPAPCSMFYLASNGCSSGPSCKYGHDYLLEAEHYDEMRENAKKGPCPYLNKDEPCPWGENECIHGHVCPNINNSGGCRFYKEKRCKFTGANMHRANTA